VSAAQVVVILAVALPVAAVVLWPLLRDGGRGATASSTAGSERRLELVEERDTVYRALRELDFDHEAGHLADDDYRALRDRYEARAAGALSALDALGPAPVPAGDAVAAPAPTARGGWTRSPVAIAVGGALLVAFGVVVGVGVGRYTEPVPAAPVSPAMGPGADAPAMAAPGPMSPPVGEGGRPLVEPGRPIPPEILQGMLQAARQSLMAGRYAEAIAAYQAVLKRDPKNVDALTHLGFIVALGGHADTALETIDKALAVDPNYALAHYYRGQVLYEAKRDAAGAIKEWERFVALVPSGPEHDQVQALLKDARAGRLPPPAR
jgi:tetratricopeptide (TPR) repeat protein